MKHAGIFFFILAGLSTLSPDAQAQNAQVTVSGVVPAKSDSRSAIQKARPEALGVASRNAWMVLKKRSEFQSIVFNFEQQQDAEMVSRLGELCTPPVDIDQTYDKKLGQLTFRFRFECDQRALLRDASRLNGAVAAASGGGASGNGPREVRARLSGIFLAIKDDRVEEFDATVKQSAQDSASVSAKSQASASSSSDERVKGAFATQESTEETYGESGGRVSEGLSRNGGAKGRLETASKSEAAAASDSSVVATREIQRSGSRVRQSAKVTRVVVSAQEIQKALTPILQRDRFGFIPYGTVAARCNGLPFEQIQEEVRSLPADMPMGLRDTTRERVLQAVAACSIPNGPAIQYYVEAYAKIGAPGVDPATGAVRVVVRLSQSIYDAMTGEEVSTTPEQQVFGVGADEAVATSNAFTQAAESVGQNTVANLAGLGI